MDSFFIGLASGSFLISGHWFIGGSLLIIGLIKEWK